MVSKFFVILRPFTEDTVSWCHTFVHKTVPQVYHHRTDLHPAEIMLFKLLGRCNNKAQIDPGFNGIVLRSFIKHEPERLCNLSWTIPFAHGGKVDNRSFKHFMQSINSKLQCKPSGGRTTQHSLPLQVEKLKKFVQGFNTCSW